MPHSRSKAETPALDRIGVADIDGQARDTAPFSPQSFAVSSTPSVLYVPDREMHPGRSEPQRHRATDALRGARDNHSLSVKPFVFP